MSQKSDIRYSIDTRLKLARLTERIEERIALIDEIKQLLQAYETSTEEYDEFEIFINSIGDIKRIKRTELYEKFCMFCLDNNFKPQTRLWFGKQLRLSKYIRVYHLNGYEYLDISGINEE